MTPIVLTVPMFSSPAVQVLLSIIVAVAAVRAIGRFFDTLPVT